MSRPYACVKPVVAVLMRLFFRVEVKNPEHVPLAGAVLLVANHSSLLDPPLVGGVVDRKSTRLNSSHGYISYAVFCLKKKNNRSLPPPPPPNWIRQALPGPA